MKELSMNINGMMCEGCENRVKNAIKEIEGIENVTADHITGKISITSKNEISIEKIKEIIDDLGFDVVEE